MTGAEKLPLFFQILLLEGQISRVVQNSMPRRAATFC